MNAIDDTITELNEGLMENPLNIINQNSEITIHQILNNLTNLDKNLALKTEILRPKKLALLLSLAKYLKTQGYPKASKLLIDFITDYLTYMVSNKRKSRDEIIKALTSRIEKKYNYENSLMNNLD